MKKGWWVLPLVLVVVISLDQWTKYLVVSNLALYESWMPIPWLVGRLEIRHITNTGAAFGLFQNANLFFVIVSIIVLIGVAIYYVRLPAGGWWLRLSLGLMSSGALGNLIDRLRVGHVIDFVDPHIFPVFNVADSSIVSGVILLLLLLLYEDWLQHKKRRADPVDSVEEHPAA